MKLLVIGNYYEPEITSGIYLAKNLYESLADHGVEIELIIPSPSRGINKDMYRKYLGLYEEKANGNLRIHRIKIYPETKNNIKRAFRYLLIQFKLFRYASALTADVVFAQSTPPIIGITAAFLSKKIGAPFVYNLHDVFPDSMVNANMIKENSVIYKIGRIIENYTYKKACKIIAVSNDIKKNLINKGVTADKISVISNWVDEDVVYPICRDNNKLLKAWGLNPEQFYVVYAGNLGTSQNVDVILEAAKLTINYENIKYCIIGNGVEEKRLKNKSKLMRLDNVKFYPIQPYCDVSYVYSLGDVDVVTCKAGVGLAGMPSKTWSIMATKRPLLISFDKKSELWDLVTKTKSGLCSEPDDAENLANNILKFYCNKSLCNEYGNNGYSYIMNNHVKSICVKEYYNNLKNACNIWCNNRD